MRDKTQHLVNIGHNDSAPIMVDATNITVVHKTDTCHDFFAVDEYLLQASAEKELDTEWFSKISKNVAFFELKQPSSNDAAEQCSSIINLEKVTYLATQASTEHDEHFNCLIAIAGYDDLIISLDIDKTTFSNLMHSLEHTHQDDFLELEYKEHSLSGQDNAHTFIVPSKIITTSANGDLVRLEFADTHAPLDVVPRPVERKQIFQQLLAQKPELLDDVETLTDIHADKCRKQQKERVKEAVRTIAGTSSNITEIPKSNPPSYVDMGAVLNIKYRDLDQNGAALVFHLNSGKKAKQMSVRYTNAETALNVFNGVAAVPKEVKRKRNQEFRQYIHRRPSK